jgi:hypothetical protein
MSQYLMNSKKRRTGNKELAVTDSGLNITESVDCDVLLSPAGPTGAIPD